MSVWKDIRQKSLGKERRIEDKLKPYTQEEIEEIINGNPVKFAGTLPDGAIPNCPSGQVYIVSKECSTNGKTFMPGQMIVSTGNDFVVIGETDIRI